MTNKIVHVINRKKYVIIEVPISDEEDLDNMRKDIKKYKCIYQGCKEIRKSGLFSSGHMIMKILVPEKNVEEFAKIRD